MGGAVLLRRRRLPSRVFCVAPVLGGPLRGPLEVVVAPQGRRQTVSERRLRQDAQTLGGGVIVLRTTPTPCLIPPSFRLPLCTNILRCAARNAAQANCRWVRTSSGHHTATRHHCDCCRGVRRLDRQRERWHTSSSVAAASSDSSQSSVPSPSPPPASSSLVSSPS